MKHPRSPSSAPAARVRVYKYGLLAPRESHDAMLEEDRKMRGLWNALVGIGETSRKEWEALLGENPELQAATARLAGLRAELDRARAARRAPALRGAARDLRDAARDAHLAARAAYREGISTLRETRARARTAIRAKTEELSVARERALLELKKGARALGIHWSSADAAVERWRTAWSQALLGRRGFPRAKEETDPPLPYVFRYTGGGAKAKRLFSQRSTVLRIELPEPTPPPEGAGPARRARWLRRQGRGSLFVRIGGQLYAFGIVMHRPLPTGAVLKKAEVTRALRAPAAGQGPPRWDWHLCLTVEEPGGPAPRHPLPGTLAALAVGWRRVEEKLRVGLLLTSAGEREEIWLPDKLSARESWAKDVQVRMDLELEAAKKLAEPELERLAREDDDVRRMKDDWERVRSGGLLRLAARLGTKDESPELRAALARWDRRRLRWLRIRRGIYRHLRHHRSWWWQNTALALSRRFETVVVPDADLASLLGRPTVGDAVARRRHAAAAAKQQLAAVHEGLRWLRLMAEKCGGAVRAVPAAFTSLRCSRCGACGACAGPIDFSRPEPHACGGREAGDEPKAGEFRCPRCALEIDRGENTARNLLASYSGGRTPA